MRKYKIYIVTAIILMIIPIIYKMTIKHHEVEYKVKKYNISESFTIKNGIHTYEFIIKNGKNEYSFSIENKFHKKKKIISKIKEYKEEDITCIIPIYKNNKEKEIYCRKGDTQVSKELLKEDTNYQKIIRQAKKYNISQREEKDTKREYKNITIYYKNIDNEKILIWDYKGLIIIQNKNQSYHKFFDNDLYDNIMATTTSRYFVLFENKSVNGIEKVHCYDLEKNKYKIITLETKISKDSYINGVENDSIYITDNKKHIQYSLNVKKEKLVDLSTSKNNFIVYEDGNKKWINEKEYFSKNHYFHNERIKNNKITTSDELIKEGNTYYYKEDNKIYKQRENANKVLLLEEEAITEWNVKEDEIIIKKEDALYLYNDKDGLRKLIKYNELKYNNNSIYYIWK